MFCALISYFIPLAGYELSDEGEQDILPSQIQDIEPHDPDHPHDILHPPAPLMALPPPFCLCFLTRLHGFCTSTMIHHTYLWACLPSLWTGVMLAFTVSFNHNRYKIFGFI